MARLDYFAPGVYVEEVDRGSRPIEGVQTNIAAFVGFTESYQVRVITYHKIYQCRLGGTFVLPNTSLDPILGFVPPPNLQIL